MTPLPPPLLLLLLLGLATTEAAAARPEQVHVAFGRQPHESLAVQWSTLCPDNDDDAITTIAAQRTPPCPAPKTQVRFGLAPEALDRTVEGTATLFTDSGPARRRQWMHVANLTGLGACVLGGVWVGLWGGWNGY